jgi:hypothetical protein
MPGGSFDVCLSELQSAVGPMREAGEGMQDYGGRVRAAASTAGASAGDGPLGEASAAFADVVGSSADGTGAALDEASDELARTVEIYRSDDEQAARALNGVAF